MSACVVRRTGLPTGWNLASICCRPTFAPGRSSAAFVVDEIAAPFEGVHQHAARVHRAAHGLARRRRARSTSRVSCLSGRGRECGSRPGSRPDARRRRTPARCGVSGRKCDPEYRPYRCRGAAGTALRALPVGDLSAVRREARTAAFGGQGLFFSAQGGSDVDAAAIARGAVGDAGAIRREGRLALIGRISRQADRVAAADLLDPDIEIAFAAAVGRIGDELTVQEIAGSIFSPRSSVSRLGFDRFADDGGRRRRARIAR